MKDTTKLNSTICVNQAEIQRAIIAGQNYRNQVIKDAFQSIKVGLKQRIGSCFKSIAYLARRHPA